MQCRQAHWEAPHAVVKSVPKKYLKRPSDAAVALVALAQLGTHDRDVVLIKKREKEFFE